MYHGKFNQDISQSSLTIFLKYRCDHTVKERECLRCYSMHAWALHLCLKPSIQLYTLTRCRNCIYDRMTRSSNWRFMFYKASGNGERENEHERFFEKCEQECIETWNRMREKGGWGRALNPSEFSSQLCSAQRSSSKATRLFLTK